MKETSDVWFTVHLMMKGRQIKAYRVTADKKVVCQFEITGDEWEIAKVEFNNSDLVKIKNLIRQVKQMAD